MSENVTTISDDILRQAQESIDAALMDPNLPKASKVVLEVQNYFLMFLRNDHRKIAEMYPYFLAEKEKRTKAEDENKWLKRVVWGTALTAIIMLLINGFIFWIGTTPLIRFMMENAQP